MDGSEEEFERTFGDRGFGKPGMPGFNGIGKEGIALMLTTLPQMLAGTPIVTGDEVAHHDGHQIILPKDMTYERAFDILERLRRESEMVSRFNARFNYRPDDGAYATAKVLRDRYGMTLGKSIDKGFFGGIRPPENRTIQIGVGETVTVPWGLIEIPTLPGAEIVLCDRHPDPDYGPVFELHVDAPNKYKQEIEVIFDAVEEQLRTGSIYRGKALVGAHQLEFLDLSDFNPGEIIFADEVEALLEGTLWGVLRHTEALRRKGVRRKRTVLAYGPYGTGKTSAGQRTAQIATEHGWTCIIARPGDNVVDVLRTAKLYEPAVVIVEDIDTQVATGEDDAVVELLEAFDGITAKGGELVVFLTTNHLSRIPKSMLRPGRFDAVIEIGDLDRGGVERLIKVVVPPSELDVEVDFDAVHEAMEDFSPAFVREALERAKTFAITGLGGASDYVLSTNDLVGAATSLHSQLKALNEATEGEKRPTLDQAIKTTVQHAVHGTRVEEDFQTGDQILSVPELNGHA